MGWWYVCLLKITSPMLLMRISHGISCSTLLLSTFPRDILPAHILSALLLCRHGGFRSATSSGIVSQTRLGAALPHRPGRVSEAAALPGHYWVFSETGEDWTQALAEQTSPRLLDQWSCRSMTSMLKTLPTKADCTQFEAEHGKLSSLHPWASRSPYPGCNTHCVVLQMHSLKRLWLITWLFKYSIHHPVPTPGLQSQLSTAHLDYHPLRSSWGAVSVILTLIRFNIDMSGWQSPNTWFV